MSTIVTKVTVWRGAQLTRAWSSAYLPRLFPFLFSLGLCCLLLFLLPLTFPVRVCVCGDGRERGERTGVCKVCVCTLCGATECTSRSVPSPQAVSSWCRGLQTASSLHYGIADCTGETKEGEREKLRTIISHSTCAAVIIVTLSV